MGAAAKFIGTFEDNGNKICECLGCCPKPDGLYKDSGNDRALDSCYFPIFQDDVPRTGTIAERERQRQRASIPGTVAQRRIAREDMSGP